MTKPDTKPVTAPEKGDVVFVAHELSKTFPGVKALDGVDLELRAGEVHAVVGENGAGKSTLMKILAGNQPADTGVMIHLDEKIALASPLDARKRGILLIHQEISLVPELTVAENIFLGSLPVKSLGRVDKKKLRKMAEAVIERGGYALAANDIVGELSIAKQQLVEIARASAFNCSVVIFDEPTASLSGAEAEVLYGNVERLAEQGVAVAYISHRMSEVFRLSDRITVLRDGVSQGTLETANTDLDEVTHLMIGRTLEGYVPRPDNKPGGPLLELADIGVPGYFDAIDLTVRSGEILGLYGLVGAGRSELAEVIFGLRASSGGKILWQGRPVSIGSPREALKLGIGFVPEDRKSQGLMLGLGAQHNMVLSILRHLSAFGFTRPRGEQVVYERYREALDIKSPTAGTKVGKLSGGNQQKIVLSKWLASEPKLLILDEPTRGIDVGAKSELHDLVAGLASEGMSILLISSEMPEIMGLSQRIITVSQGRITGEFDGKTVTEDQLVTGVMQKGPTDAGAARPEAADV